jgi:hypothetical protein
MPDGMRVLNVGGHDKKIPIPSRYDGWEHLLLDIDERPGVDIVADARNLKSLEPGTFDAIYTSHCLEHFYYHDVPLVVQGFHHVLRATGFVEVHVPDLLGVMKTVVTKNLDVESPLYQSRAGPISVLDVIYGYRTEIERSGNDFYAHKTGYSVANLRRIFGENGFPVTVSERKNLGIYMIAFKQEPDESVRTLLNMAPK